MAPITNWGFMFGGNCDTLLTVVRTADFHFLAIVCLKPSSDGLLGNGQAVFLRQNGSVTMNHVDVSRSVLAWAGNGRQGTLSARTA